LSIALFCAPWPTDRLEYDIWLYSRQIGGLQGWGAVVCNITPIFLPSRASELNPVENIWQYLRANWLSNRVFDTYEEIIEAACEAWRRLSAQPQNHYLNRNA
jgi:transposase